MLTVKPVIGRIQGEPLLAEAPAFRNGGLWSSAGISFGPVRSAAPADTVAYPSEGVVMSRCEALVGFDERERSS